MALPQLFSIGEMAKIFHLSVSSLRHYEALGLVSPEYVDPSTNYRYYSVRQFEPLNTIRYLRAMDIPLTEIADFLQNRDVETIEEKLRAQKAAVVQKQKELKRIERKLDARLSQLQDVRHAPLGEITLIHSPALRLFWIDTVLTAPDYSALELSTSRLAAAQAEALVFLGKAASGSTTANSSCLTRPTALRATSLICPLRSARACASADTTPSRPRSTVA